jgi:hypothetical protein
LPRSRIDFPNNHNGFIADFFSKLWIGRSSPKAFDNRNGRDLYVCPSLPCGPTLVVFARERHIKLFMLTFRPKERPIGTARSRIHQICNIGKSHPEELSPFDIDRRWYRKLRKVVS